MERTASEHRAAVEVWRATAPKNDHEIFGRKLKTEKPRHRDLSELSALLAMRSRPIGVAEGVEAELAPAISTNFRLIPANDNTAPEEGFGTDRSVEYEPSMQKIEEAAKKLPVIYRSEPMMLRNEANAEVMAKREIHAVPVGGDIAYGTHVDDDGKSHKVITRIGKLRFSDGSQTEKGQKLSIDGKVVDVDLKMPVGAMLGCREKSSRDKGAEVDTTGSNSHYRWIVKGHVAQPPKLHPTRDERVDVSKDEARQILADAYANTSVMPVIKRYPDGFPYGPSNLRQLFIGGRKGKKGESGSQAWQDIYTEKANRDTFQRGLDAMQDAHVRVLTEAMSAKSLGVLGEARGYRGRHAVDAGRRLLVAANDNFEKAMELAHQAVEA
ncbi:hypothetical protein HFO09_07650 [Rhizobium laguerreae]|uniref:hypothetical protein n=1 Tax=Rhizobium laguerreae TaxID=1076926 RepID=UPI001C90F4CA|nr:hypothetical protein [Rhizobium laguerreae]MBY3255565.1 hypothetical protein [Rhizobium laguerreae]MBY3282604.1 hypothetical protein [Rhizobium laguerreae]MBY3288958.1 hypothetical protein [Rhizobium laguerreae]